MKTSELRKKVCNSLLRRGQGLDAEPANGPIERQVIASQLGTKISDIVRSNGLLCPDRLSIINFGDHQ